MNGKAFFKCSGKMEELFCGVRVLSENCCQIYKKTH